MSLLRDVVWFLKFDLLLGELVAEVCQVEAVPVPRNDEAAAGVPAREGAIFVRLFVRSFVCKVPRESELLIDGL